MLEVGVATINMFLSGRILDEEEGRDLQAFAIPGTCRHCQRRQTHCFAGKKTPSPSQQGWAAYGAKFHDLNKFWVGDLNWTHRFCEMS